MAVDVVVTGVGAVTPLGATVADTWAAMVNGRSGIGVLDQPWAAGLSVRIAGQAAVDPAAILGRPLARRLNRVQAMSLIATREAMADAGLAGRPGAPPDLVPPDRLAVCFGTGVSGLMTIEEQLNRYHDGGERALSSYGVTSTMASGPAAAIGVELGAEAGVHSMASACATGAEALLWARSVLRDGRADVVIAGGADAAICPLTLGSFARIRALSTRNDEPAAACRPWDRQRDGFVLGEGAGVLVLERADHAAARGARPYARMAGAAVTSDGHDLVSPRPDGLGMVRAVARCLADAGLAPADVDFVNAHSTGTPVGDLVEARSIRESVGVHPAVTANKSLTGHLLGASGAVESIATVLSIRDGVLPPTLNLDDPDDGFDLDVVRDQPRKSEVAAALKLSFGFGGHNVALLFTTTD